MTLSAGFLDVEAELRFFTGTVKVVENAEPFIRLQLHALTAESPEVGDQVSSHTGKVVSRFLYILLAYRNGDIFLLNDRVCAGRLFKKHPVIFLTVLVKSIALQGEKNGFLKVCTIQTAVVNGDLGGCAAVKAVEQFRIFKEHSFLILSAGNGIVDVAELVGLGELISAHLKNAVVVYAGGQGIMIIFEGMGKVFHGEDIVAGGEAAPNKAKLSTENAGKGVFTDDLMKVEDIKNGYCTQFLINKYEGASAAKMRAFAESNGDSVVCIEDDDVINLHVHTADPGKILSEAIKYGYLTNFKIENMHEQFLARQKQGKSLEKQASAEKAPAQASEFVYAAVDPSRDYGFVAVAAGEGLKAVFTDLAADAVVSGGQTMNPATEDILAAIQSVPAKTVFVLPNNKNIIMAAEQAQKLADRQVIVLPTRTVPMGITALLNFDPSANAETNTINMMAAADKVSTGLITYAARDSEFDGKRIRKGEIMALENGKIVATSTDLTKATYRLARSMCKKDSSFVTIISGCDVSDEEAEKLTEIVKAKCPNHVEVSHIRGGQPVYYYMISVE